VRIRQPARVESVEPGAYPSVRVRDLETNAVEELAADHVIVADGKATFLGREGRPLPATYNLGIKAHFMGVDAPRDCIELFGTADCYGGLAPIEGGRWNAAFSVPSRRVRDSRGDIEQLFLKLASENVVLARRLSGAMRIGQWLASPLPRFGVRDGWPQNVIPVGNAAAAIEPIGGEGMGLAIRSAELATGALTMNDRWDSLAIARLAAQYRRLWTARGVACRTAARAVSSRRHADRFMPLVRALPKSLRPVLFLMGK
jgi:2-polyprenyl-6-methoxyphenol hydroxylase-like FAD-dependent oxidoreductase